MKRWLRFGLLLVLAIPLSAQDKESLRIEDAGRVMEQVVTATETIPRSVLDQADCVLIIPSVLKLSVGVSGSYAAGVMSCRGARTVELFIQLLGRPSGGEERCD